MSIDGSNLLQIENFIYKITFEQANEILDSEKGPGPMKEVGLITEWGAIIPDTAKIIVEFTEDGNYYVASIGMLVRSKDGVFVQLKHDVNEVIDNLPNFNDIFKLKEL